MVLLMAQLNGLMQNNVKCSFTRAKEYVYVIGDATKWAELNKNLAFAQRYLPVYTLEDI